MAQAFARSKTLFALIAAAMGNVAALAALPEYVSRGKGRGTHSGKKWAPHSSGANMDAALLKSSLVLGGTPCRLS
jgi:hypothetical protein